MSILPWLDLEDDFPPCNEALEDPNGLLAAGADLSPERILYAYQRGVFPWFSEGQPVLWWSPNPRCTITPRDVHISRSLKKFIRKTPISLSFDQAFEEVITLCAREDEEDGWITEDMKHAYTTLHNQGHAHSLEVWVNNELAGGLYGIAIGRCFFGESMFSLQTNCSKIAFAALCHQLSRWNFKLIDCQVENPHLLSLGASCIDRDDFLSILGKESLAATTQESWQFDDDLLHSLGGHSKGAKYE